MNFDSIKENWKNIKAPGPQGIPDLERESGIIEKIREIEEKRRKQHLRMFITMPVTLAVLWYVMLSTGLSEVTTISGFALLNIAITGMVLAVYMNKIPVSTSGIGDGSSVSFLEKVLKRFKFRKVITVYLMPVYGLLITGGIFLMYIEILEGMSLEWKVLVHAIVLLYCVGVMIWGIRKELKKYKANVQPVVDEIERAVGEFRITD
jgi:hypothetical protein